MTGFQVEPADIVGFGKLVGRAVEDVTAAIGYLGAHVRLDGKGAVGELWELVTTEHDDYVTSGRDVLRELRRVLDAAEGELARSAQYYENTDRDEAARLDATFRCSRGPGEGDAPEKGSASFHDSVCASALLRPPQEASGYLEGHAAEYALSPVTKSLGTVLDFGSVSTLANEAFRIVLGVDPMGEVQRKVAGDWDAYTRCGQAWDTLGEFCVGVSENVSKGNSTLEESWDGNSANAAWVYFDELAKKIAELEDSFSNLRGTYESIGAVLQDFPEVGGGYDHGAV